VGATVGAVRALNPDPCGPLQSSLANAGATEMESYPLEPIGLQRVVSADNKGHTRSGWALNLREEASRNLDCITNRGGSLSYLLLS
jgi:hypothetical protein